MAVFRATYTITVLGEFESKREAERNLTGITLAELGHEITDGEWIGQFSCRSIDEIEPGMIENELLAVGNDGSFFQTGEDK